MFKWNCCEIPEIWIRQFIFRNFTCWKDYHFTTNKYSYKQFSKILCSICKIFILKSKFIEYHSEAVWRIVFNYSFTYIPKSILTLRRQWWYGCHMKTEVWRFGRKWGDCFPFRYIKRFLLTGLFEFSDNRVIRINILKVPRTEFFNQVKWT